jgi:DNA polymerase (family 10)
VRDAVIAGVMMSISTDAHDLSQFDFMRLGIGVARRGWCGKENILNTKSWADICNFRKSRREKNHDPIN